MTTRGGGKLAVRGDHLQRGEAAAKAGGSRLRRFGPRVRLGQLGPGLAAVGHDGQGQGGAQADVGWAGEERRVLGSHF